MERNQCSRNFIDNSDFKNHETKDILVTHTLIKQIISLAQL